MCAAGLPSEATRVALVRRAAAARLCHQDSQMSASASMASSVVTVYSESLHF